MTGRESAVQFRDDPLQFLDQAFRQGEAATWLPGRQLCLAEATAARAVLTNSDGLYQEHSDFFYTKRGVFGPRSVQVEIGRESRKLLREYMRTHAHELSSRVQQELDGTSAWPDAGNWLVYHYLAPALLTPDSPARLRQTVDAIVERAVLAGARQRRSRLSRAIFRFRVMRELERAVNERRARSTDQPADVLDVIVRAAGKDVPAADLAEVFLSFVFAAAGSVGFVLGWSIFLMGTHPNTASEPGWIVREALRLWPVAWFLARRPVQPHAMAGIAVTPQDQVIVCPYAVHRNPQHWDAPNSFRPERWATDPAQNAFIPFGSGPHTCVAAALSIQLVEDILRIIIENYHLDLTVNTTRPCLSAALAPPQFTLALVPRGSRYLAEGRR
ncbi:MAG TPA: cytochrome P450 [Herpetosiphonaceae bacterium]